jgi:putative transposase
VPEQNPVDWFCTHDHDGLRYRGLSANYWDNAVMKRFFLNLKMERVWHCQYPNHSDAIHDVTDYIVNFYSSWRLHSSLGYLPPNGYEMKMAEQQPILVSE